MSPWDAVERFGHVEPAFTHLRNLPSSPPPPPPPPPSFIPRAAPKSQFSSAAVAYLSPTHDLLASPVNGTPVCVVLV